MSESYIPAYEAYYKADSRDPSQAERLAIWKAACGAIIAALSGDDVPAPVPCPMDTAPRDGTMVRLLVQFDDHATEDKAGPAWTIGANNDDNVGNDEREGWRFAGWCWDHDHFTEGKGTPVGWLPMMDSPKGAYHPDDAAVDAFAAAMKAKLADARAKGRGGWNGDQPGMHQRLSDMLRAHVEKGDPRDVANFCMFLHQRGEAIGPKGAAPEFQVPAGWALVPDRMQLTPENMELLADTLRGADEDEPWCGGVLWIGQTTDDDGEPTYYGLNVGNVECLEEGSINIVEFDPPADSPKGGSEARVSPWRPIAELPISDDLFWFARDDTIDGPRAPQAGGYDADEWNWFAPAEAPDFTPEMDAERDQLRAELNKARASDAEVRP